ncbi:MAG: formate dehydrogenase subunit alpha [Candidatus Firestonebacteria bacterium]
MHKIKININDIDIETNAVASRTIMEVADENGIRIPRLCYHPLLPVQSACRLCVVEVEGAKNLVASCAYPVSDGMKVKTDSPRVIKARRVILELLISNHPLDCMTCEECGKCLLQKYAYESGVSDTRFKGEKYNFPVDDKNPFITSDYNKCILCGRCVAVCKEIQYCHVTDFVNRGFDCKPGSEYEKTFDKTNCVFCGNCVSTCPVGALIEKDRVGQGREWDIKRIPSICPYCGVGCQINLVVKDNKILWVEGRESEVVNCGWLCVKGKFGYKFIDHPDRLKKPLIKVNGKFKEVSWEEAIELVAKKFNKIKTKYGSDSFAILSSAKCTNEENYLMQKFARAVLGTNNIDHCARLCHAPSVSALGKTVGSAAMSMSITDIPKADCLFVIGNNTTETHPITALYIKKAVLSHGAKLIVADPRKIELTKYATVWLRQKSGTDVMLLNGLAKVIIEENLVNKEFIKNRVSGYEEFEKEIRNISLDEVSTITGVSKEKIVQTARLYAKSSASIIFWGMGITQHITGTDNAVAISNLALITGHIGKENAGVAPLRGQCNVQGSCDMGVLPDVFPGYQSVVKSEIREKFAKAWNVDTLPEKPGLTVVEMIQSIKTGKIKAMYIMGENPVLSDPNHNKLMEELKHLEILIVQDIFLTETAELADVVLPASSFAEKDGTFTNTERRIQRLHKALNSIGESKPDWQIINEISAKMGYLMKYNHPSEIMDEISKLVPSYAGVNYDRLDEKGLQWPVPEINHPGTKFLHKDKFSIGQGKLIWTKYIPPSEKQDKKYPYILITGRILFQYHTRTMTGKVEGLNWKAPEPLLEINPSDAKLIKCKSEDMLKVSSRRGSLIVKAVVTDKVPKGEVFITFHYKDAMANMLTNDEALDPYSKIPEYKVTAVKVEKDKLTTP